jgi:hypothetical protein
MLTYPSNPKTMKALLLVLFITISSLGFAQQVSYSIVPKYACANVTHDLVITATNNQSSIPAGFTYTVTLNVKDNQGNTAATFSQSYTDGFANGDSKTYTIPAVTFGAASTWTIDGSVAVQGFGTFPIPSQNYFVKIVPVLSIINNNADISPTTTIDGYSVRYYLNGNYQTIINESTTGNYTAIANGTYTAKAINYVYVSSVLNMCESASPSNGIQITTTAIEDQQSTSISVYPNPMTSTLTISSGIPDELSYDLYDRTGMILRTGVFKQTDHLQVGDLKSGMYMLVLKNKQEKIASYKLVK